MRVCVCVCVHRRRMFSLRHVCSVGFRTWFSAAFSHFLSCPPRGLSVSHAVYEPTLDPWCLQRNTIPNVPYQTATERLWDTFSCLGGRILAWQDWIHYKLLILSLVSSLFFCCGEIIFGCGSMWLETVVTMTNQSTCVELRKSLVLHDRLEGLQKGMAKLKQQASLEFCC